MAVPFSLLEEYDIPRQHPFDHHLDTWKERMERTLKNSEFDARKVTLAPVNLPKFQRPGRLPMSLVTVVVKKKTSKKKFVRLRIINKLKTSLYLVAIRGAEAKGGKIVMDESKADSGLILRGWTYMFFPNIEMYLMPFADIIQGLRKSLDFVQQKATKLEMQWAQESLKTIKTHQAKDRHSEKALKLNTSVHSSSYTNTLRSPLRLALDTNIEADNLWEVLAKKSAEDDTKSFQALGTFSDADLDAPETNPMEDLNGNFDEPETSDLALGSEPLSSAQTGDNEPQYKDATTSSAISLRPIIDFMALPSTAPSPQVSPPPRSKLSQKWNFSAALDVPPATPGSAAAVENEWAKAYSSPLEMAKRKIFHSQPIFGKIPEVKGKHKARSVTVEDLEKRRSRAADAKMREKDKRESALQNKLFKLWDEKTPIDESGTGFGVKKDSEKASVNNERYIFRRRTGP